MYATPSENQGRLAEKDRRDLPEKEEKKWLITRIRGVRTVGRPRAWISKFARDRRETRRKKRGGSGGREGS